MKFERDRHENHWHNQVLNLDWRFIAACSILALLFWVVACDPFAPRPF
jgi:hypothetical protein